MGAEAVAHGQYPQECLDNCGHQRSNVQQCPGASIPTLSAYSSFATVHAREGKLWRRACPDWACYHAMVQKRDDLGLVIGTYEG